MEAEQRLYRWWEEQGHFKPDDSASGEPFTLSMPPPNVTGKLHMGHAMFATLQDIMVRYQRMRGRPTLWLPGTDHAGIATQVRRSIVIRRREWPHPALAASLAGHHQRLPLTVI